MIGARLIGARLAGARLAGARLAGACLRRPNGARPPAALVALVIGALAILGLLGMHTIHRDVGVAAPSALVGHAAIAMTQSEGHASGDSAAHGRASGHDGPVRACGNCAASTPSLASACTQALWLFVPFLLPPRRWRLRLVEADADEASSIPIAVPRAPSLDALCISRT
ncbi:hypothetical protein GCM10010401_19180 [Rarobacter faecitabidus]|nr:pentapeptide repeat-containing protein [Rarobacter faecitabidus]